MDPVLGHPSAAHQGRMKHLLTHKLTASPAGPPHLLGLGWTSRILKCSDDSRVIAMQLATTRFEKKKTFIGDLGWSRDPSASASGTLQTQPS